MATWVLRAAPWTPWHRVRFPLDRLGWSSRLFAATSVHHFSTPASGEETPFMAEMKRQRYPSMPLDVSLFEDTYDDYSLASSPSASEVPLAALPANPSDLLQQLVTDGNFVDANRVLTELTDIGVTIEPAAAYFAAGIHVLEKDYEDPHKRLSDFAKWWSLIPDAACADPEPVRRVQSILFTERVPDLPLVVQFALMSTSKGYASVLSTRVILDVFRHSSPARSFAFLEELCDQAIKYETEREVSDSTRKSLKARLAVQVEGWYTCAVKSCCITDRLAGAVALVQNARARGFNVHDTAYAALVRNLKRALDMTNLQLVQKLRETEARRPEHQESRLRVPRFNLYRPPAALQAMTQYPDRSSLAAALRILRHSCMFSSRYPLPSALATFIEAYRSAGQSRALHILRARSYKRAPATAMWALSEMLYYHRRNRGHMLLLTFIHHFHMIGVPQWAVWRSVRTMERAEKGGADSNYARYAVLYPPQPLGAKLFPSTHHTALVWHVTAQSMRSTQSLEELYQELLTQIAAARYAAAPAPALSTSPASPTPSTSTSSPNAPAEPLTDVAELQANSAEILTDSAHPPDDSLDARRASYPALIVPPMMYDSGHFNAFVLAFGQRSGPTRAAQVVADMYRHGIQPSVETLTMLIASFASIGDVGKLTTLLDRMEASADNGTRSGDVSSQVAASSVQKMGPQLPPPNVVTYTAVIKSLMDAEKLEDALAIAQRLRTKLGYVLGTNHITDSVLNELAVRYVNPHNL